MQFDPQHPTTAFETSNCTNVELKFELRTANRLPSFASNCTNVELKFLSAKLLAEKYLTASNCTNVELK